MEVPAGTKGPAIPRPCSTPLNSLGPGSGLLSLRRTFGDAAYHYRSKGFVASISGFADRLLQTIFCKAERDELGSLLERICVRHGETGLELEFWFQGCSEQEATHYATAAIRDAAASIAP